MKEKTNNLRRELFVRDFRLFSEGLDRVKILVGETDENKLWRVFGSTKWQIDNLDSHLKSGKLQLRAADSRLRIELPAWRQVCEYVRNKWETAEKLARVSEKYRRATGEKLLLSNDVDGNRRWETLRELNALGKIVNRHQNAYGVQEPGIV